MWERLSHSKRTLKCVEALFSWCKSRSTKGTIPSPIGRGWREATGEGLNKTVARIIRDAEKAWFSGTSRAGFASAHAAPYRKFGLTLAEVLITLGIIGIVAAMTLPTIIQKQNEKATVSRLKKVYSTTSQAFMTAVNDNGTVDNWGIVGFNDSQGAEKFLNTVAPYFKVTKNCGSKSGCLAYITYKDINGKNTYGDGSAILAKARLADGTFFYVHVLHADCSANYYGKAEVCGTIAFDINGAKGPNQHGIDLYRFYVAKNNIVPAGISSTTAAGYTFERSCAQKATDIPGTGCAAWVLFNENMDYLHCSDLSWSGKKTCKQKDRN